jgi:transglutaminase-like putative cysteine protease
MRIKISHETTYTYGAPVRSAVQLLRLTPRSHEGQFVRRWRVEIDADSRLDRSEDAFGNVTHLVFIDGPVEHLRILIEGEVDTEDTHGVLRGAIERQPPQLYLRQTALTGPTPAIARFARDCRASQGGDPLATLHRMNGELHLRMAFRPGTTNAMTPAGAAFDAGEGVCQDFANVLIAAARTLKMPCRYVSGYYLRSDTLEQDAGHAWVEAFIPGLGWVGFDPAHGTCVTDRYVRLAIGCDYLDAAPIRGTQAGGTDETLKVAVRVEQGRAMIQE